MADENLQFKISVQDDASKALAEIAKGFEALTKAATSGSASAGASGGGFKSFVGTFTELNSGIELAKKGFSALATAVTLPLTAMTSLVDVGEHFVQQYDEAYQSSVKLSNAMRLQGASSAALKSDLLDFASALQDTTRFEDDEITNTIALIGSFTGFGPSIKPATQAALDLSAALSIPLPMAAREVVQAMETGKLAVKGISLTFTESEDAATRASAALAGLSKQFGGTSAVLGAGGAAGIIQTKNIFQQLEEEIGKAIAQSPQFQAFIAVSKTKIKELTEFVKTNSVQVGALFGQAFSIAVEAVAAFGSAALDVFGKVGSGALAVIDTLSKFKVLGIKTAFQEAADGAKELFDQTQSASNLADLIERISSSGEDLRSTLGAMKLGDFRLTEQLQQVEDLLKNFGEGELSNDPAVAINQLQDAAAKANVEFQKLIETRDKLANDPLGQAGLSSSIAKFGAAIDAIGASFPDSLKPGAVITDYRSLVAEIEGIGPAASGSADEVNAAMDAISGEGIPTAEAGIERFRSAMEKLATAAGSTAFNFLQGIQPDPQAIAEVDQLVGLYGDLKTAAEDFGDAKGGIESTNQKLKELQSTGAISADTFQTMSQALNGIKPLPFLIPPDASEEAQSMYQSIVAAASAAGEIPPAFDEFARSFADVGKSGAVVTGSVADVHQELQASTSEAQKLSATLKSATAGNVAGTVTVETKVGGAEQASLEITSALNSASSAMSAAIVAAAGDVAAAAAASSTSALDLSASAAVGTAAGGELRAAAQEITLGATAMVQGAAAIVAAGQFVQSSANSLVAAGASLSRAANDLSNAARGLNPPGKAVGGIVTAQSLVQVAEAGPELIAPRTERGAQLAAEFFGRGFGGGGPNVHLDMVSMSFDERTADLVAQRIERRLVDSTLLAIGRR